MAGSFFISCEEEYLPDNSTYKKQIVLEAYIEKSTENFPVYAFASYSFPFFGSYGVDLVNSSFVHGAYVEIEDADGNHLLQEICINDLPEPFRTEVLKNLGIEPDSIKTNICVYVDLNRAIKPEVGIEYKIKLIKDFDTLTATTSIPQLVPLDSIWFDKPAGINQNDTFAQMFCIISDLPDQKDYYRYFTAGANEYLIANLNSVTDDVFFDGQKFKFTLSEAIGPDEKFGDNSGLWRRGDTVKIKWCNIPSSHYDFWKTLETSRTRQGPFASYVRIDGNVHNGLGIFGGQHCVQYQVFVPKQ